MTHDASTNEPAVLVERRGAVSIVTLNRPHAFNAADETLHGALAAVWPELAADDSIGAIVLTGAGAAFSGGGDLHLLDRMVHDHDLRVRIMTEAADIVRAMTAVPAPIVAAVNGPAVGLGCSLAAMADLVLIEESAYFADPHAALGLVAADGAALTWPSLMSLVRAKEYILLGERIRATTAVELGLANRVVADGSSLTEALAVAERLAGLPPQSVRETKKILNRAIRRAVADDLSDAVARETESFDEPAFQANLRGMLDRMNRKR